MIIELRRYTRNWGTTYREWNHRVAAQVKLSGLGPGDICTGCCLHGGGRDGDEKQGTGGCIQPRL